MTIDQDDIEAAHDVFTDAYMKSFPAGGDRDDHDEATRCGVEAVLKHQVDEIVFKLVDQQRVTASVGIAAAVVIIRREFGVDERPST